MWKLVKINLKSGAMKMKKINRLKFNKKFDVNVKFTKSIHSDGLKVYYKTNMFVWMILTPYLFLKYFVQVVLNLLAVPYVIWVVLSEIDSDTLHKEEIEELLN